MSSAQDVRFNEGKVQQGRDLANKLWNASRLILLRVSEVEPDPGAASALEDRWIVSRLERLTARATELYDGFRFSHAALDLYGAFWSELCDWYLELVKPRLYEDDNREVSGVLLWALERTLKLLHPVMPFVTEEIWSLMPGQRGLLATAEWPEADESRLDEARRGRGRTADRGSDRAAALPRRGGREGVGARPRPAGRRGLRGVDEPPRAAGALRAGGRRVGQRRRARHRADPGRRRAGAALRRVRPGRGREADRGAARAAAWPRSSGAERKLANEKFVERAPAEVVEEERRKLEEYREALRRLGD